MRRSQNSIRLRLEPLEPRDLPSVLALHPENPHYFLFRDAPAALITSGEHYGAVLNLDFDYVPYLDELQARGFNLTRTFSGTYREYPGVFGIVHNTLAPAPDRYAAPWARSDVPGYYGGGNKFDLSQWDEAYFARLHDFVQQAGARGIVVELVLYCTLYSTELWNYSPMHFRNNVNGVGNISSTAVFTLDNGGLLPYQDALVRKLAQELNGYDNVYYEIINEPYSSGPRPEWWNHIIGTLADEESGLPWQHLIAQNIANGSATITNPNPAVSIFNFHYATPPAAVDINYHLNKVIGDDETGFRGMGDTPYRTEGWEFFVAGGAVYSNLDYSFTVEHPDGTDMPLPPGTPGGGGPSLRAQLQLLKEFLYSFDFIHMVPDQSVIRGGIPGGARARALAMAGESYALYVNGGSQANLVLALPANPYRAEWVEPRSGRVLRTQFVRHGGGNVTLASPTYSEDIALRITHDESLPPPWATQDIGNVGHGGGAYFVDGTFLVQGSGADIWGTSDAFHFVHRPLTGDGWIFAQVSWVEDTDPWAKAGLMVRESLAANSKHASVFVTPGNGASFQRRVSTGGSSTSDTLAGVVAPYGVYLERIGDYVYALGTADYVTWEFLGEATIPMAATVYVGLAVTSHNNAVLNTSAFDGVYTSMDGGAPGGGPRPSGPAAESVLVQALTDLPLLPGLPNGPVGSAARAEARSCEYVGRIGNPSEQTGWIENPSYEKRPLGPALTLRSRGELAVILLDDHDFNLE